MRWRLALYFVILTFVSPLNHAESSDKYLCVAEEAVGFTYDHGEWRQGDFDVKDRKYIIRELKDDELKVAPRSQYSYGVFLLNENLLRHYCKPPTEDSGVIICKYLGEFYFNPAAGRYLSIYSYGYWIGEDNNQNTPLIERGQCSKI